MGKFFTSLTLTGLFILLTSAGSYADNTSSGFFDYPREQSDLIYARQNFPSGIFAVAWEDCENDVTKPTITAPADINLTSDTSLCIASNVNLGTPSTADNCNVASVTNNAPETYPLGITTVIWTVTDDSGNTETAVQTVTVTDTHKPTISAPADITVNSDTNKCTASGVTLGTASTADNCSVASVTNNGPATYPLGTTTVTWTVSDDSGNTEIATQLVTVADNQKPTITAPADITINTDVNQCTASGVTLGTASTADNCSVASVTNNAPATYPLGTTTVTWKVTDDSGNTETATQLVTIADNQKPTITAPADITVNTDVNQCTASGVTLGTASTADNCSVASVTSNAPATYPLGTTTVTWTVTDDSGNTETATQLITVADNQKPRITPPADITVNTDVNQCTASGVTLGTASTADNCGVASVTSDAPATYPLGTTTVIWTVTDEAGNKETAAQTVTVSDNYKPVITAGTDITLPNITGQCYAGASISPATASDNCSVGTPKGTRSDGQPLNATYPVGTTIITWTVSDVNGNDAVPVEQTVTVEDKEAPLLPELEPEIRSGCAYIFEVPTTTDNCDSNVSVTHTGSLTFSSSGEITWTFTDDAGNSVTASQRIIIDPIVVISVDKVDVLCNGLATGSIAAQASGGVAPYTYDWGTLGAGDRKTDLPAGTYYVKATDANGCSTAPLEVVIAEPDSFVAISSIKTTTGCYQQNDGTATVEATGGVGNYTYSWSNGQTTQKATGLAPGTHSVTVTDANGCNKTRDFTISAPQQLQITGFLTTETTSYGSATGTATAQISGGTPNYTFRWSNGATGQTARDLAAGKYTVTVTDLNGCSATREVTIVDALDAIIMPTSICEGDDDIVRTSYFEVEGLTAKGGTPGYTYAWTFGENATPSTATGPGPHRIKYSVIGDKKITLKVTDAKGLTFEKQIIQYVGGCFSNDCGSNDLAADNYFIGDANGTKITSSNCAEAGQKYLYISFPTQSERYSLNIEYIYSVTNLSTGATENFKEAGCFYSQQPIPRIARTIPIDYSCGDLIIIEGIYLTFSNNKTWKCGQGPAPKCYSTNNETSVTLPLYGVAFPNELLCNGGEDGIINARASGGTGIYTYKLISSADGTTARPSQPSSSFTGLRAGRYKVVVSDGVDSYTTTEVEVKQPSNPLTLELVSQSELTCFGGSDASATVVASGGTPNTSGQPYIYSWANIGQTSPTATNLSAGTYTVRAIDANGCEVFLEVVIDEPKQIPADAGPDQVLPCGNLSTYLNAVLNSVVEEGEPAPQGIWSIVNGPAGGKIENINDPRSKFTGVTGTYTLRWSVSCGATDDVKISFGSCSTLDFDGKDDHVVIGNKFDLPSAFSIEAWIKQNSSKTAGIKTIFSERDNSALSSGGFDLIIEDNVPKFRWNGNTISSNYPIGTDRWYHIAVILGGDHPGLYVDGIKVSTSVPGHPTPTANPFIIGASYNSLTPTNPENYFHGWIEEVRVWRRALTLEQLRFLMNQRLNIGTNPLRGTALPIPVPGSLDSNTDLIAYYPLVVTEITNGTTKDKGPNGFDGTMVNIATLQENTAPLPYISARNGAWTADNTWLRPAVWDHPNSKGVDGSTFIDWNIVVSKHNISSQNKDIMVLGLRSEAGRLSIVNPSGPQNEYNSGQKLRVTHYLKLDGVIDLFGESQLLQDEGSILDPTSTGYLEKDQQGRASSYNYNYWTSPVSVGTGLPVFSVAAVMKDGTTTTFKEINFGDGYRHADGGFTTPRKVSRYWIHKFFGTAGKYSEWQHIGSTGPLQVGEGYSMKGTSGYASLTELQNYTFVGMPNNGTIGLTIGQNQNYLVGNPYPSAIDANEFIKDNLGGRRGGKNIFNGSLYFWSHFSGQTHYLSRYVGGYAVYNLSGGIKAIANDARIKATGDEGGDRPQQYIPVAQAFFVNTVLDDGVTNYTEEPVSVDGGEILFKNSQRIFVTETDETKSVFHTADKKDRKVNFLNSTSATSNSSSIEEKRQRFWLRFKSPAGYYRQLLVTRDPEATSGFDLGYDAPLNENNLEDMYWMINDSEFVIQGVPDFGKERILPLGIKTTEEGEFIIAIDELENIPDELPIYVRDSINDSYHNLRESDFKTNATAETVHDRYAIVFDIPQEPTDGEGDGDSENPGDGEPGDENGEPGDGDGEGENETPGDGDENPLIPPGQLTLLYSNQDQAVIIQNPDLLNIQRAVLFNGLGQELQHSQILSSDLTIPVPVHLPNTGVYFIKVYYNDGSKALKFLVE